MQTGEMSWFNGALQRERYDGGCGVLPQQPAPPHHSLHQSAFESFVADNEADDHDDLYYETSPYTRSTREGADAALIAEPPAPAPPAPSPRSSTTTEETSGDSPTTRHPQPPSHLTLPPLYKSRTGISVERNNGIICDYHDIFTFILIHHICIAI